MEGEAIDILLNRCFGQGMGTEIATLFSETRLEKVLHPVTQATFES